MPPSAASKTPRCSRCAPVNAPCSWPKSGLSRRVGALAPQLTRQLQLARLSAQPPSPAARKLVRALLGVVREMNVKLPLACVVLAFALAIVRRCGARLSGSATALVLAGWKTLRPRLASP